LRGFLNLGLKLKGNPKGAGPALLRTNIACPVIYKSIDLLCNTSPDWTSG